MGIVLFNSNIPQNCKIDHFWSVKSEDLGVKFQESQKITKTSPHFERNLSIYGAKPSGHVDLSGAQTVCCYLWQRIA